MTNRAQGEAPREELRGPPELVEPMEGQVVSHPASSKAPRWNFCGGPNAATSAFSPMHRGTPVRAGDNAPPEGNSTECVTIAQKPSVRKHKNVPLSVRTICSTVQKWTHSSNAKSAKSPVHHRHTVAALQCLYPKLGLHASPSVKTPIPGRWPHAARMATTIILIVCFELIDLHKCNSSFPISLHWMDVPVSRG